MNKIWKNDTHLAVAMTFFVRKAGFLILFLFDYWLKKINNIQFDKKIVYNSYNIRLS